MQLTKTFFISLLAITTWATVNCQQDEITGEEKYQPILYHRIALGGWMVSSLVTSSTMYSVIFLYRKVAMKLLMTTFLMSMPCISSFVSSNPVEHAQ